MEKCKKSIENCPAKPSKAGCRLVMHHIFYPRSAYATETEIAFRELPQNRVKMCAGREIILHKQQPKGPPKPSLEVMEHCVETERLRRELPVRPIEDTR